jgi:hypothetical protein
MESYIVRIYRREEGDAITGVVEDALSRRGIAFQSIAELSEWLRKASPAPLRKRARPAPDRGNKQS